MEDEANDPNFPSSFNQGLRVNHEQAISVLVENQNVELPPIELDSPELEESKGNTE